MRMKLKYSHNSLKNLGNESRKGGTMKTLTKRKVEALFDEVRSIVPNRPMTYGHSIQAARNQAFKLRQLLDVTEPDIDLLWLIKQKAVPVHFMPSYRLNEQSGLTTDQVNGMLEIFINDSEPRVRQRFSALHELKHVLDWPNASVLHSKLGSGDQKLQNKFIEQIADEFA